MSSGEIKISGKEIQRVQNLIEQCLQLYMNKNEVVETLLQHAKIDPNFTGLVWEKLEEENQKFFEGYHLSLLVKEQIMEFNELLRKQVELIQQPAGVSPNQISSGSQIQPLHQNIYAQEQSGPALDPHDKQVSAPKGSGITNAFINSNSSLYPGMQTPVDVPIHAIRMDVSPNMQSTPSSNMGIIPGMNGETLSAETEYAGASPFMHGANHNDLGTCFPVNVPTPSLSLGSLESNLQTPSDTMLDSDISFGILDQIPEDLLLPDLIGDFSNTNNGTTESYSGSPFPATEMDNFLAPHVREHPGYMKRLDSMDFPPDNFGN